MNITDSPAEDGTGLRGRARLLADGFTDLEIRAARATGALTRLYRGVYAVSGETDRPVDLLRIVGVAARSPSLVVSHTSAAVLHGLPLWLVDISRVHLTRNNRGGSARTPGRTVHTAVLGSHEVQMVGGVPVTTVARTLADLARCSGFETAVIAADYALHRQLVSPTDLTRALVDGRHRPGNTAARRALVFADGRAESPGESRTRVLLHRLGLPPPSLQVEVFDRHGIWVGRTDLGYEEDGALIEFDGRVKYQKLLRAGESASDAVVAEKKREDCLRSVGLSVLRIVWSELAAPALIGERVLETRRQGRALLSSGALTGRLRPRPAIGIGVEGPAGPRGPGGDG